jgi:glycosyltransferase involved in cell wall biosynthesis
MNNKPLVSILIPCYNSKLTIDDTIQSAIKQSYSNLEIIVNDDFSIDGTLEYVIEKYGNEPRILIYQNIKNLGMCENWNILFDKAKGDYWLKLDADDIIKPQFIEITLQNALQNQAVFSGSSYEFLDVKKNKVSEVFTHKNRTQGILENPLEDIFINYPLHLCFTLLKASFVKKISPNYYFLNTEVGDAEFQIRAALHSDFKAYFDSRKLGYYCFHGNNSSLVPLKQAKSFIFDILGLHHKSLNIKLGYIYRKKLRSNFKLYLKEMILIRTPWNFKLLNTTFKYAYLNA